MCGVLLRIVFASAWCMVELKVSQLSDKGYCAWLLLPELSERLQQCLSLSASTQQTGLS